MKFLKKNNVSDCEKNVIFIFLRKTFTRIVMFFRQKLAFPTLSKGDNNSDNGEENTRNVL